MWTLFERGFLLEPRGIVLFDGLLVRLSDGLHLDRHLVDDRALTMICSSMSGEEEGRGPF